jgi:hypothetical protein
MKDAGMADPLPNSVYLGGAGPGPRPATAAQLAAYCLHRCGLMRHSCRPSCIDGADHGAAQPPAGARARGPAEHATGCGPPARGGSPADGLLDGDAVLRVHSPRARGVVDCEHDWDRNSLATDNNFVNITPTTPTQLNLAPSQLQLRIVSSLPNRRAAAEADRCRV